MTVVARAAIVMSAVAFLAACSSPSNPVAPTTGTVAASAQASGSGGGGGNGGGGNGGGGNGGGGGGAVPPSNCVAEISSFSNTPGYGPYGPNVADIRTKVTVKNCTSSSVAWTARATYTGPFWGGGQFAFPLTCSLTIGANASSSCQITERYLLIQQTYAVTLDVLDGSGNVLATTSGSVATPSVPNPNAT